MLLLLLKTTDFGNLLIFRSWCPDPARRTLKITRKAITLGY